MIKHIKIDSNESKSRKQNAQNYYDEYETSIGKLDCGDYLFISEDGTEVVFEYKTAHDFFQSIQNNHLHNQTIRAKEKYKYQFIIIQSSNLEQASMRYYYDSGVTITQNQITGAITSLNTISTVLHGATQEDCFDIMLKQAIKIIEDKPLMWKFNKKSRNPALNFISSCHGFDKYANRIVDVLGLYSCSDLLGLTVDDLVSIDGIGKKRAKLLISYIGNEP